MPNTQSSAQGAGPVIPRPDFLGLHVGGVAPSIRRTLVWESGGAATLAASVFTDGFQVLLNSPFDPDVALGGVSAAGFAKYMALYSKCFVLGARIKVKFASILSAGAGLPNFSATYGVTITTNTTALTSTFGAITAGLCQYELVNINPDRANLTVGVDIAKFVDKPDLLDDPQWYCTSAANPTQLIVAHIWAFNWAAVTGHYTYEFEVEYDCVFTDPIPFS